MRTRKLAALVALIALLVTACGTQTSADLGDGDASPPQSEEPAEGGTATEEPGDDGQALPPPVAAMREQILAAADDRDYERLAALGLEGRFTASFGGGFDDAEALAEYWRGEDGYGAPTIDDVVIGLLGLDPYTTMARNEDGEELRIYVWPRAQSEEATDADRQDLYDLFGRERVDGWYADGMYLGWRLGITAEGDWQFFVAGD